MNPQPLTGPTFSSVPQMEETLPRAAPGNAISHWQLALLIVLLSLLQSHTWPGRMFVWVPTTGIVFALAVWFGCRTTLLLFPAAFLTALRTLIFSADAATPRWELLPQALYESSFQVTFLAIAVWSCRRSGVAADLRDPRSAVAFLLLPGLILVAAALLRTAPLWLALESLCFVQEASAFWVAHGLGLFALAPPLLIFGTPWLIRAGITGPQGWMRGQPLASVEERTSLPSRPRRLAPGDWVEIGVLGLGIVLLSLLLTAARNPQEPSGWQLWGAPLLLIVWAGIRQGLQGAPLVAAGGTAAALELLNFGWPELRLPFHLQGNLLAQCATALLVASSVSWVRTSEQRYRQVVSQIPVVLYSTRLLSGPAQPLRAEIFFVNPPCRTVLGCPPAELIGDYENWMQRVHPDDREILRAALVQLGRQNQPVVCEYRVAPRPGEPVEYSVTARSPLLGARTRWVRDVLVPHLDADGQLDGWEGIASDITEQRLLADDLRRTTNMFNTLVTNLPAGVFFVSARSGRPILVNQRARQLLGQREDAAAGLEHLSQIYRLHRPDGTLYPPEELPVAQALTHGSVSMRDDIVVYRPDGRRLPLISWAAPVNLGQGNRTDAVVWVLEDLTELRQAEAARRETEGRLRTVIESLAEGLLVQDRHEAVIDSNPAAKMLLGPLLDSPGAISRDGWVCEDGSPLSADEHPIRKVLRTGVPVRNVVLGLPRGERTERETETGSGRWQRASGRPVSRMRWLLINSLPLAPKPGTTPAGVVTTLVDVSDHIQAQQLIRESEERYHGLVDSLPLMVLQFDRQMRLTLANPAMQELSGYTLEEVSDPNAWTQLVHPEDLPGLMDHFQQVFAGNNVRCEVRYRARDGQERICYYFMQPVWSPDEPSPSELASEHPAETPRRVREVIGVTALVLDLTRERRLEQELHRAQRLELVGRLSSSIAHDFNNLLAALLGLTEIAELKLHKGQQVKEELRQIAEVGEQATHLAQQILAFCKHRPVPHQRVDVNRAARRTADIVRNLLPREIRLACELSELPLFAMADEIQLQQVVMNLCLNARDAMPKGGLLQLRTSIEASGPQNAQAGPWLCLSVQDSGEGMTAEVQRRLFEPFFSTKERGTGLGLSTVKELITSFGGKIVVRSEPGKGSRFDVWLPLAREDVG